VNAIHGGTLKRETAFGQFERIMKPDNSSLQGIDRYQALLDVSTAVASQPDIQELLRSVSDLLSKVVSFNAIALLLNRRLSTMQLYALAAGGFDPGIPVGTEVPFCNTVIAEVLDKQEPALIDARQELQKIPQLVHRVCLDGMPKAYIFPVSSPRRKLGVLIFGATDHEQYGAEDIALMGAIATHVSVAVESALALEAADRYRGKLEYESKRYEHERDRLKLLLDINNHTVTQLDIRELFLAASASIRGFFGNAFTGFWLFEEGSNRLQCVTLDFPNGHGYVENLPSPQFSQGDLEKLRIRMVTVFGQDDIKTLPAPLAESLTSESIISLASVPLLGSSNPLGLIALGSCREKAFSEPDLDLLVQVANQISLALENALAYGRLSVFRRRLEDERHYLESEIRSQYNFDDIIGNSPALRKVLDQVSVVAPTDSTVLLVGETGTGKELIARAIHNLSLRRDRTFVRLNCAAIPQGLMESELFGHEKGAFTGALAQKQGRIELAHEGTLFLDEIGDVDLELQPKLLRVLQEREFERLGSNRTLKIDVRLITATNRDLPAMVRNREFREDLYYRLNVFPIVIPPLRERKEDIPPLVHYFVSLFVRKMRKPIRIIPREVMAALMDWVWPGNVRELQNFIERSVILSRDETLAAPIGELKKGLGVGASSEVSEREAIVEALRAADGRISGPGGAAERLGMKRTSLRRRIDQLRITKDYA